MDDRRTFNGNKNIKMNVVLIKMKGPITDVAEGANNPFVPTSALGIPDPNRVEVPISSSSILELIINESALEMGVTGTIIIDNQFNILESLDLVNNSSNEFYIRLDIEDVEVNSIGGEANGYNLLAHVRKMNTSSINYNKNIATFKFEEAFVSLMRHTAVDAVYEVNENADVIDMANKFNAEYVTKLGKYATDITVGDHKPNSKHPMHAVGASGRGTNMHDAITSMMKESRTDQLKCPYFKFINVNQTDGDGGTYKIRKLHFAPYITDRHLEFLQAISKGDNTTELDFSDVYLEKFATGPFADIFTSDPNITADNKLERYNTNITSPILLKESNWGNYQIFDNPSIDPGIQSGSINTRKYSEIQKDYIEIEFPGLDINTNTPVLKDKYLKKFEFLPTSLSNIQDGENSVTHQRNYAYNSIVRPFITINETMSFTSPGSLLRTTNKFIWIERTSANLSNKDNKKHPLDNIYYTTNITHRFRDGDYYTEVIASKWFGDTTLEEINDANPVEYTRPLDLNSPIFD